MSAVPETRVHKPKSGIRAVAEQVSLSPSAVSLALRGSSSIPLETRARVQQAAENLNYVHKPRHMRERRSTRKYIFIMDDHGDRPVMSNPFFGEVLAGAENQCADTNSTLTFCLLRTNTPELALTQTFTRSEMDGILLVGPYPPSLIERVCRNTNAPIVLVDNWYAGCSLDSIMADDFAGSHSMTQHLIELGHRNILPLFRSPEKRSAPAFTERLRGYQTAMRTHQLEIRAPLYFPDELYSPHLIQWIAEHLHSAAPFTALLCANDTFAGFALQALKMLKRPAPKFASVSGYDDLNIAQTVSPALSTVRNHPREMGAIAVQRLAARLNNDTGPAQHIRLGVSLVARESTRQVHRHESLD